MVPFGNRSSRTRGTAQAETEADADLRHLPNIAVAYPALLRFSGKNVLRSTTALCQRAKHGLHDSDATVPPAGDSLGQSDAPRHGCD
jgi:hypothetical protein